MITRNGLREIDGAFAKYIVVKGDLQIKTPDNISDEEAATLGVAVTTVVRFSPSAPTRETHPLPPPLP